MKILIADDHAVVRKGLRGLLSEEFPGAQFGEASDGNQAYTQVVQKKWDVAILDVSMGGRGGLDVIKDIRRIAPTLPILIMSMHPEDQFAVRALKSGAAGYLTKETAPDEIGKALRKILSGRKYVSSTLAEKLALGLDTEEGTLPHEALSDREFEVMRLIASGKRVKEIGSHLSLSVKTISTYRTRILEKMGMESNAQLTHYTIKHGLIE
ncbi:two component transcriptional regulator, LuxR family [Verrucomicrobium sp. GAS474]|uniref:response regulator n=1 Tax=Verrucomicrobium sp. GAS474 TaxID=1882831 RepID=UPI00087ACFBB|nr:response regulator transcription factor [Verrucomicrobium sp. GAS474]SDU19720.1 two component transcriptional regulator, LuxR family [Verrucomicrobium sp. GAS474]